MKTWRKLLISLVSKRTLFAQSASGASLGTRKLMVFQLLRSHNGSTFKCCRWPCSSKAQKAWQQDQEGAKNQEAEQIKQDLQLLTITITSHDAKNRHKAWGCCVLSWVLWNKTWVKGIEDKTHASPESC